MCVIAFNEIDPAYLGGRTLSAGTSGNYLYTGENYLNWGASKAQEILRQKMKALKGQSSEI